MEDDKDDIHQRCDLSHESQKVKALQVYEDDKKCFNNSYEL